MTIEVKSLTISFFEEDKNLWEVIQSYPLDQQTSVIKKVLAQYLKEEQGSPAPQSNSAPLKNANKLTAQSELNLETLFISSKTEAKSDQEETKNLNQDETLENKISVNTSPLQHLFEIIGEEEDEDVLQYIKATDHQPAILKDMVSVQRLENSDSVEPIHQNSNTSNNGLDFLLKQVIGEEEDEEVLQFFDSASK